MKKTTLTTLTTLLALPSLALAQTLAPMPGRDGHELFIAILIIILLLVALVLSHLYWYRQLNTKKTTHSSPTKPLNVDWLIKRLQLQKQLLTEAHRSNYISNKTYKHDRAQLQTHINNLKDLKTIDKRITTIKEKN